MKREDIRSALLEIIRPYLPEEIILDNVKESDNLLSDLNINSAFLVDIILNTEERFDITIEDDVIGKMETVENVIDLVVEKMKV